MDKCGLDSTISRLIYEGWDFQYEDSYGKTGSAKYGMVLGSLGNGESTDSFGHKINSEIYVEDTFKKGDTIKISVISPKEYGSLKIAQATYTVPDVDTGKDGFYYDKVNFEVI